ncbi:MAG: response regulator [Treponema sp.]|nr:response regulator [Treponema sp.]
MIRIIIVEDEKILRKGLALHTPWRDFGAVVIADVADGIDGEQIIEKLNPDIVITDIRMPGLSGIEMMRRLKGRCDSEFILISGYGEFAYAQEALALGAKGYIMKPIDDEELFSVLRKTIEQVNEKKRHKNLLNRLNVMEQTGGILFKEYYPGTDYREKYLETAINTINSHYRENLSASDLSQSLGISESSFSKIFKNRTGYTFLEYLTNYRVQKAMEFLDEKSIRISEVAAMVGYTDYRHFGTVFKKIVGITPSEYRKGNY